MGFFRDRMDELHALEKEYPMDFNQWEDFGGPTAYYAEVASSDEWRTCITDFIAAVTRAEVRYNNERKGD